MTVTRGKAQAQLSGHAVPYLMYVLDSHVAFSHVKADTSFAVIF